MAGFQGADTDQLREHAELMRNRATSLDGVRTRLSMLVTYGAEWEGPDAEAFRDRWHSEISPRLDEQIGAIEQRGTSLEEEADEQDKASEDDSAPGLWEKITGIWENVSGLWGAAQGIFNSVKTFKELIEDFPQHVKEWKSAFKDGPGAAWDKYKDELSKGMGNAVNKGKEYSELAKKALGKLGLPGEIGNWDPLQKHLDEGKFPKWLAANAPDLAKLGKIGGKILPGADILLGANQMINGETTFDKVSGGLAAVGGGLVLAAPLFGPAAPIVAGVGAAAGVVSIGMDLGKMAWENREAIGNAASAVADGVSDAASSAAESIGDGAEAVGDAVSNVGGKIGDALGFG